MAAAGKRTITKPVARPTPPPSTVDGEPYGVRVSLKPGDTFRKIMGADWHRVHWYATAAERDAGLADNSELRQVLQDYFAWATTTTMSRYHRSADEVPKGLRIPQWSWDGLQA